MAERHGGQVVYNQAFEQTVGRRCMFRSPGRAWAVRSRGEIVGNTRRRAAMTREARRFDLGVTKKRPRVKAARKSCESYVKGNPNLPGMQAVWMGGRARDQDAVQTEWLSSKYCRGRTRCVLMQAWMSAPLGNRRVDG